VIFARPYDPFEGDPLKNTAILDAMVAAPQLLPFPVSPEDARVIWASTLTSGGHIVFEVWREQDVVGVIWLTRVIPKVDATLNFHFFDKDWVGKRKLLQNFLTFCFAPLPDGLELHRLSMEVPEGSKVERFVRRVCRFRYEGESRPRNPQLPKSLDDVFVARQGSRREGVRFDGQAWSDSLVLRLLASEWALGA
jgi:hypothetical protein